MLFTKHAKRRLRQRSISQSRLSRAVHGKKRSQGKGVVRSETDGPGGTTVVIYKRRGSKKVILSAWKVRRPRTG